MVRLKKGKLVLIILRAGIPVSSNSWEAEKNKNIYFVKIMKRREPAIRVIVVKIRLYHKVFHIFLYCSAPKL